MRKSLVLFLCIWMEQSQAQTPAPQAADSSRWGWKHSSVSGLNLTQVSFKDWAQGGEDALAWTVRLDGLSKLEDTSFVWSNVYKMAFGQAKIGTTTTRKTDDRLEFESVFTYKLGAELNPYVAASLKTQFAQGIIVDDTGHSTVVSKFFDPAYLIQSAGFGYRPSKVIRTRLGAALREIITSSYRNYANDRSVPMSQWEKVKVEGGVESVTDLELTLDDNILFRSNLELFSPIRKMTNVTMRMDNTLLASVNKYVVVMVNVQFINDARASSRLQQKEVLSLGLTYTLF